MSAKVSDRETGSKLHPRSSSPSAAEPPVDKMRWIDDQVHPDDGMSPLQLEPIFHSENTASFADCCECLNPANLRSHFSGFSSPSLERKEVGGKDAVKTEKSSENDEIVNAERSLEDHNGTLRLRSMETRPLDDRLNYQAGSSVPSRTRDEIPQMNAEAVCLSPTFATVISCLLLLVAICGLFFLLVGIVIFAPINLIRRRLSSQRVETNPTHSSFRPSYLDVRRSSPMIREVAAEDEPIEESANQPTVQEVDDEDRPLLQTPAIPIPLITEM